MRWIWREKGKYIGRREGKRSNVRSR